MDISIRDYSKLKGRMKEQNQTQSKVAQFCGMSPSTLSLKLSNHSEFSQSELERIAKILHISPSEFGAYFFAH